MNELTVEWLRKAEGDCAPAGRETRARRHPNYDAACFHAQQAAEKYLKALLQEHGRLVLAASVVAWSSSGKTGLQELFR